METHIQKGELADAEDAIRTVNAYCYTVITAHKRKREEPV